MRPKDLRGRLAAAEIDMLMGSLWPLRQGAALLLVLQELRATGVLASSAPPKAWPMARSPNAPPPTRAILVTVMDLFDEHLDPLDAAGFCQRMAQAYGDALHVGTSHGEAGIPAGCPRNWFRVAVAQGLTADGLVAAGHRLNVTAAGYDLERYYRETVKKSQAAKRLGALSRVDASVARTTASPPPTTRSGVRTRGRSHELFRRLEDVGLGAGA